MKKTVLFWIALLFTATTAFAGTVPDENGAKELSDQIMAKVAAGDLAGAFSSMKLHVPISATEIDSVALQSKAQREQYGQRYGASTGFEFIDSKKVGEHLLRLRYIEMTDKHALPWVFYFYKSADGWLLNSFRWNDEFQQLFTDN